MRGGAATNMPLPRSDRPAILLRVPERRASIMRKHIASIMAAAGLLGALAAAPAQATPDRPDLTFGGSCDWITDGNWYWSNAYHSYYRYRGHVMIAGRNYRVFTVASFSNAFDAVVYCGG